MVVLLGLLPGAGLARQSEGPDSGEVRIELDRFGVGRVARAGDWTGVRLKITDTAVRPREVLVRIRGRDLDGDVPVFQRDMTTNPGVGQFIWLYTRLPFSMSQQEPFEVTCMEALEGGAENAREGQRGFRAGRLLGRAIVTPHVSATDLINESMIGVVASPTYGLSKYSQSVGSDRWAPLGHELTRVVNAIRPAEMPDRWIGLLPYEVLVWGTEEPTELRGERAQALIEWVKRGGHLVIILPAASQSWTNAASNELYGLLPAVRITRREGVNLEPYRPLLMKRDPRGRERTLPTQAVLSTFTPLPTATTEEAVRVLVGPDGECIAARRLVGTGMVTLIGLDLNQRAMSDGGLIDADVFWHRVLGRRGELKSEAEIVAETGGMRTITLGSRYESRVDPDIAPLISKTGRAAKGVLLGFVIFAAYWLLAGPIGYAVLRRSGFVQHAWIAFVAVGAVFTAVAWTGATLIRARTLDATHFTLVDHVFGQETQRARSWMSVLIPRYGEATIAVGEARGPGRPYADEDYVNLITAWEPHRNEGGAGAFPDSRPYFIDARRPDAMTVPVRATVKQIQADWAGRSRWSMPIPVTGPDDPPGTIPTIRFGTVLDEQTRSQRVVVEGFLVHQLPGPLTEALIVVVHRQENISGTATSSPIARVRVHVLPAWAPGQVLDLRTETTPRLNDLTATNQWFSRLLPGPTSYGYGPISDDRLDPTRELERIWATALFPHLTPPRQVRGTGTEPVARRSATHGWDLGEWFTQPCIIIIGQLGRGGERERRESPVPITVDGEAVKTSGRTVVRWVFPLPDDPPPYAMRGAEEAEAGSGEGR